MPLPWSWATRASGTFLGVGIEVKFKIGLGEDNRALIAAFGDQRAAFLAYDPLLADQFLADPGVVGGDVGDFCNFWLPNGFRHISAVQKDRGGGLGPVKFQRQKAEALGDAVGVVKDVVFKGIHGHRAVHGAGVEVGQAEPGGQTECGGRFTGTCWSINGYDQREPLVRGLHYQRIANLGNLGNKFLKTNLRADKITR